MRRCPSSSRCRVAASPPAKLVAPTLVTRARGRSIGSITTSGRWARASAVTCRADSALTTPITACRPAAASSRTQVTGWSATALPRPRRVTDTVTPASVAGVQYALDDLREVRVELAVEDQLDRRCATPARAGAGCCRRPT